MTTTQPVDATGYCRSEGLALGADFVLLGRAFMFALGAIGNNGGEQAMRVLQAELRATLGQLGCTSLRQLPDYLIRE